MAPPDPTPAAAAAATTSNTSTTNKRRRVLLHEAGQQPPQQQTQQQAEQPTDANGNGQLLPPHPQLTLRLGAGFEAADLRLLEATPEVLAALTGPQSGGAVLRVVGCEKEATVALVTGDATFEMCRVETSNMLLLVPPMAEGAGAGEAVGRAAFHYELKRSKPKVEALKRLLAGGDSAEEADRAWTLAELEQRVQGSQAEILKLLKLMNALEVVPGQWRAVEEAKVNPTLDRLLTELLAAGVPLERVKESRCRELMPDVDPILLSYCLRAYGALNALQQQEPGQEQEQQGPAANAGLFSPASHPQASFALDVAKIARFKAHQIFRQGLAGGRPQGGVWERAAFLLEWEASLPSTHRPDPSWLRGVALEETVGGEERLRYMPAEAMPLDPVERVKRLFEARRRWAFEEVAPYLRELFPDDKALGDHLMKHSRAALGPNGERTYSAK